MLRRLARDRGVLCQASKSATDLGWSLKSFVVSEERASFLSEGVLGCTEEISGVKEAASFAFHSVAPLSLLLDGVLSLTKQNLKLAPSLFRGGTYKLVMSCCRRELRYGVPSISAHSLFSLGARMSLQRPFEYLALCDSFF